MGSLVILLALLNKQLLRFIGLKPLSEVFTTPRFQRSAKITEKLGRLFLVVFGVGSLIQGIGPLFLPNKVTLGVAIATVGLLVLILLATFGVTLANWKAK
jgi:hypothetical protein